MRSMGAKRAARMLMTTDTVGGVWQYAVELAGALGPHGVEVALASMGPPVSAAQRRALASLPNVRLFESTWRLEWMPEPWDDVARAGEWLLELERALRPQIVHLNQFAFGALPFRAPKVVVAHSCVLSWWKAVRGTAAPREWARYRQVVRDGLSGADVVVAPSRAMLRTLRENYGGIDGYVIANARSSEDYAPAEKKPYIFSAGRLWDDAKNLSALEAVAPHLSWPVRVAGWTLQPAGGVRRPCGVTALGALSPERMAEELAGASIYALPARYEPFGLSVLEAALAGCALVLGDIPSLREIWGGSALYVQPDDYRALRTALTGLADDRALRMRLSEAARGRALSFTPARQASAYLSVYRAAGTAAVARSAAPSNGHPEVTACAS